MARDRIRARSRSPGGAGTSTTRGGRRPHPQPPGKRTRHATGPGEPGEQQRPAGTAPGQSGDDRVHGGGRTGGGRTGGGRTGGGRTGGGRVREGAASVRGPRP